MTIGIHNVQAVRATPRIVTTPGLPAFVAIDLHFIGDRDEETTVAVYFEGSRAVEVGTRFAEAVNAAARPILQAAE